MHSKGIIHRDLKSLNVLIDQEFNAHLIDFGASRMVDKDNFMTGNIGTVIYLFPYPMIFSEYCNFFFFFKVHWMPPEIFLGEKYTEKADVYSFGLLLWELWTRQQPFEGINAVVIPTSKF